MAFANQHKRPLMRPRGLASLHRSVRCKHDPLPQQIHTYTQNITGTHLPLVVLFLLLRVLPPELVRSLQGPVVARVLSRTPPARSAGTPRHGRDGDAPAFASAPVPTRTDAFQLARNPIEFRLLLVHELGNKWTRELSGKVGTTRRWMLGELMILENVIFQRLLEYEQASTVWEQILFGRLAS